MLKLKTDVCKSQQHTAVGTGRHGKANILGYLEQILTLHLRVFREDTNFSSTGSQTSTDSAC